MAGVGLKNLVEVLAF